MQAACHASTRSPQGRAHRPLANRPAPALTNSASAARLLGGHHGPVSDGREVTRASRRDKAGSGAGAFATVRVFILHPACDKPTKRRRQRPEPFTVRNTSEVLRDQEPFSGTVASHDGRISRVGLPNLRAAKCTSSRIEQRWKRFARSQGPYWRVDETRQSKDGWTYLSCRRQRGRTVDFCCEPSGTSPRPTASSGFISASRNDAS